MSDDSLLREKAREVIETGTLPNRRPDRTWAGRGVGAECAICRAPVTRDEIEYEIEFSRNGGDSGLDSYHVHVRCLEAWVSERHN